MKRAGILRSAVALAGAAFLFTACDDDPTRVDEHLHVEGIAILEGGEEIYRYMQDEGAGTLTLSVGTHDVVLRFLDHDGDPLPEEDDEDHAHELRVTVTDQSVLTWTAEDHDHAHAFIEFHGELDALQPGDTDLDLCVPHGNHCDFEVVIPVTVVAAD